jgi:hypothetical protein
MVAFSYRTGSSSVKEWALLLGARMDYLDAVASDPAPYTDNVQAPGSKNGDAIKVVNPTFSASLK